jgi:predicted permease
MSWLRQVLFRLQPFWRRRKIEKGLSEEIESHITMATEANIAAGMSLKEARNAAVREFGGVEQIKERYRDERTLRWLEELFSDIRFAARSLRKSPGFATVAILTLALCIGANSAVFSVVCGILLRPYPWADADRLVFVDNTYPRLSRERGGSSIPDYLERRTGMTALEESALFYFWRANFASADAAPEQIGGAVVTPSLFPLLKVRPQLGRAFSDDDAKVGAANTIILTDRLWRNRFGADPKILEREIRLDGEKYTVIGVMPPDFYYPGPYSHFLAPFQFTTQQKLDPARSAEFARMMARLKVGATTAQAQRQGAAIQNAAADRLPQLKSRWEASGRQCVVVRVVDYDVKDVRAMLWLLQGAVAVALLIGCANVASLLLARASARGRELAIRAALGASRGRLTRYLLTESLLLFVTSGALGLLVAPWGISVIRNLGIGSGPRGFQASLDGNAFVFTLG